ncbi:MAG: DsbA family oxidoreductase [Nitrospira sp.]|nr:DsbA family oxidoreductase [Nitrospira sp.]
MIEQNLKIEVYSDVVCPWCYVGKRRLERALQQLGSSVKTDIQWRPFQLNPTMPQNGMDRTVYLETKFGSLAAFKEMEERLLEAGRAEQIPFSFDKIARTPNTFLAHRLIWYAGRQGKQDAVVEELFRAYFVEGNDIGNAQTLAKEAKQAGLEPKEVELFLASETGIAEVKREEAGGHQMGIRGVPYFVLNDMYAISGAQRPEAFLEVFQRIATGSEKKTTHR